MSIPFRYVRRRANPSKYIMAGFSDFTGQFDPAEFEMVEDDLPVDSQQEIPRNRRSDLLAILMNASVDVRAQFYPHLAAIACALDYGDPPAALRVLQSLTGLSAEVETLRQDLLARLQQ